MKDSRTDDRSARTTTDPSRATSPSPEGDDRPGDARDSRFNTLVRTAVRSVLDVGILVLWVVFLTLLFLGRGWPRWAFYGTLLIGVAVYVSITSPWTGDGGSSGSQ